MPVDPRGVQWRPDEPYLAYEPNLTVRFLRSQYSWPGESEIERLYRPPSAAAGLVAGWAAARPNPNLVPFTGGAPAYYALPSGPSSPRQLLQQATLPPQLPPGSFQAFMPALLGEDAPPMQAPFALAGLGAASCDLADAVAAGLQRAIPALATAIGVQSSRAANQSAHPRPANIDIPVRAWEFNEAPLNPVVVNDSTTFIDVTTHRVPIGTVAVARQLEVLAETPAALADVEVRITVGGVPVPRYDSLNAPDFGDPGTPAEINVKAIEDQLIVVQARPRTALAVHRVIAILRGWDTTPSYMANLDTIDGWRGR